MRANPGYEVKRQEEPAPASLPHAHDRNTLLLPQNRKKEIVIAGDAVKEKWKNLRDTYKKHKKSTDTTSKLAVKKLKNWVWASHMQFLDGYINMKTIEGTPLNSTLEINLETILNTQSNIQASTSMLTTNTLSAIGLKDTNINHNTEVQQQNIDRNRRKRINKDPSDKIIDYLRSKTSKKDDTNKLDRTDYLFLNYADTFKRLTPRRQVLLKLELAKLFTDAELADMDGTEISPAHKYDVSTQNFNNEDELLEDSNN
ncbi:unnamed protein product [Diatraea saccharalis]|uniref:MADF domain-containing protein n=1 Tax=Diatraea saccharalis TaxID=40085 RepID=A0A9N9RET2_9NEOP|nr:unnamed protein product [Diatraea saccharalis]